MAGFDTSQVFRKLQEQQDFRSLTIEVYLLLETLFRDIVIGAYRTSLKGALVPLCRKALDDTDVLTDSLVKLALITTNSVLL